MINMCNNKENNEEFIEIDENSKEYRQALIDNFNEDDDVILPNSLFGELVYIFYILRDMAKNRENIKKKWKLLKRQMRLFRLWRKNNYGKI